MNKKVAFMISMLLIFTMVLSSCTGSKSTPAPTPDVGAEQTDNSGNSGNSGNSDNSGNNNVAVSEAPQTLTYAIFNDPDGIDPGITQNTFAAPFLYTMFTGLVRFDLENNLVPGAATSWDISDDGTVYTFHLNENMNWSNGTPVKASDFEFAWKRVLTPSVGSQAAQQVYMYIKNGKDAYEGKVSLDEVGIKSVDDKTLEVTLESAVPFILQLMATWTYFPLCQEVVENNPDWTKNPSTYVTNGPFRMEKYSLGDTCTVVKNEYYFDKDKVNLERIDFKIIPELATALSAYEKGEIDGLLKVPASESPRLKSRDDFYSMPQFGNTYYLVNTTSPALDDVRVRKALALALDRTSLIEDVLQTSYEPALSHVPRGYVVDGVDFRDEGPTYDMLPTPNLELAKQLLAEAGYPDGKGFPKLRLGYYTNETQKKVAEAMQQMWKQNLNVEFEIVNAEWTAYYDQVVRLDYDICAMGDLGTYLHPMAFLATFTSDTPPLETGWRSQEYENLILAISAETDSAKANELMHKAEDLFMYDYPLIPLYSGSQEMMMADYVKNWNYTPTGTFVFDQIKIEK